MMRATVRYLVLCMVMSADGEQLSTSRNARLEPPATMCLTSFAADARTFAKLPARVSFAAQPEKTIRYTHLDQLRKEEAPQKPEKRRASAVFPAAKMMRASCAYLYTGRH
jgi:hypothetical protein